MKVLLIQPPHEGREPAFFPLGLGYIAKVLLKNGINAEVLDIWVHGYSRDQIEDKIKKLQYDIVGISAFSTQYGYIKWLASRLKLYHENKLIVVGGPLATHSPELVLQRTDADVCVMGEGEFTFNELIKNPIDLENVEGICYKEGNRITRNLPRKYIKNLDTIEFPAWDLFPVDIYLKNSFLPTFPYLGAGGKLKNIKAMNVITSRGCPYNCRFCSKTFHKARFRSVDNVVEEIKTLKRRFNVEGIFFNDELFMISKKRAFAFCEELKDLNIQWCCQGRVNVVDLDLLQTMQEAGCISVGYGVESGSQIILNKMNKQITVDQTINALKWTKKAGLHSTVQMIYGYPGENLQTLKETIELFQKAPGAYTISMSVITPLPGSELYDECIQKGIITDEDEYLQKISGGYVTDECPINLTEFTPNDFIKFNNEVLAKIRKIRVLKMLKEDPITLMRLLVFFIKNKITL